VDTARQRGTEHTSRIWTSESLDVAPSVPLLIATKDIVSGIVGKGSKELPVRGTARDPVPVVGTVRDAESAVPVVPAVVPAEPEPKKTVRPPLISMISVDAVGISMTACGEAA
jgi:hypothetical protein